MTLIEILQEDGIYSAKGKREQIILMPQYYLGAILNVQVEYYFQRERYVSGVKAREGWHMPPGFVPYYEKKPYHTVVFTPEALLRNHDLQGLDWNRVV